MKFAPITNPFILITVFGIIISLAWMNHVWINSAYGQNAFPQFPTVPSSNSSGAEVTTKQSPTTQAPSLATTPSLSSTAGGSASKLSSSSIEHGVRIISPTRNQQVPAGAILTISGVSKDNATSDCNVNVNVNHVRPYQNTSAAGPGGPNDYSNWTFSLTPKYTAIKQGLNEITAKFFCSPDSDRASFYSMNVTGIPAAGIQSGGGGQSKVASVTATTNSSNTTATVTNQTGTTVNK